MPDNHISEELKAVIELTAQKVSEKFEARYNQRLKDAIEMHALNCQNKRLSGFKAVVIGIVSGAATLIGNWILNK